MSILCAGYHILEISNSRVDILDRESCMGDAWGRDNIERYPDRVIGFEASFSAHNNTNVAQIPLPPHDIVRFIQSI